MEETKNDNKKMGIDKIVANRAFEIEEELKKGVKKPFDKVIHATLGCCHRGGQKPLTFVRQVLAAITYPDFLETDFLPADVKEKAKTLLNALPGGSMGSYSLTEGVPLIRQLVAKYIEERDNISTNWNNIYLTNGASGAVLNLLMLLKNLNNDVKVGVFTPIPDYPLYTTILNALGMVNVGYYLDEENQWSVNVQELEEKLKVAKCIIKAIVVINPGNPTAQVLTKRNIEEIINFSNKYNLMIIADEVYQMNVHNENVKFHSFKKVIHDLNLSPNNITLASLMSASKGFLGECGLRGGYIELDNMKENDQKAFEKLLVTGLCSTTYGQAALYCLFNLPKENEPSYEVFLKEKTAIVRDLKIKAKMAEDTFNSIKGFQCRNLNGSLYAYAAITFPHKVLKIAEERKEEPDVIYCRELLENTGVSVAAGSAFGQKPGTYHIRVTLLQSVDVMRELFEKLRRFHQDFMTKYS